MGRNLDLDSATAVKLPVCRRKGQGKTQDIYKEGTFRLGKIPKFLVGRQRDSEDIDGSDVDKFGLWRELVQKLQRRLAYLK